MYYAVVEFKSRNTTKTNIKEFAVVPLIWIIKNERRCYWPTTTKIPLQALIQESHPPKKQWPHYSLEKVHFKTEIYVSAENELERLISENTEINNSSAASHISIVRKSAPSDDSSDDYSDDSNNKSPNKRLALSSASNRIYPFDTPVRDNVLTAAPLLQPPVLQPPILEPPLLQPPLLQPPLLDIGDNEIINNTGGVTCATPPATSTSTMTVLTNMRDAFDNEIIIDRTGLNTEYQNTVLNSLAKIQTTNDQILLTMQEILRYHKKVALDKLIAPENLPSFPLKTYEEFLSLEKLIREDPSVNQYLIRRLAALGGSGLEGVTRRIMKYLFTNQLGLQFNWKGRYNKVAFENTTTMDIVYEAAKLNFPTNEKNDLQVAWSVKEWLKHSGTRMGHGRRARENF